MIFRIQTITLFLLLQFIALTLFWHDYFSTWGLQKSPLELRINPEAHHFFLVVISVSPMGILPVSICCSNLFLIFESCLMFYTNYVNLI